MSYKYKTVFAVTAGTLLSVSAVSAETQQTKDSELSVTVTDTQDEQISSNHNIDAQTIQDTPSSNGNLSDYLKSVPNVRFESSDQEGFTNGEIKPAAVSINGADASQTAYMVDGVNINNDIDPTNAMFNGEMAVNPGKSAGQAYFFDANMMSGIKVYDSNVPAHLGGFMGGAVVAETRKYSGQDRTQFRYRTTNDQWADIRVNEEERNKFKEAKPNGNEAIFQPKYKKNFFSAMTEQSLTENWGMVVGFSRRESDIRQARQINPAGDTDNENHTRKSDNLLTNFTWNPDTERTLDIALRYSGYDEGKYFADNLNGDLKDKHVAYGATLEWEQVLNSGTLTATAAYDNIYDERKSSSNVAKFIIDLDTSSNYETGGYGHSEVTQQNSKLALDYKLNAIEWNNAVHQFRAGADITHTEFDFTRHTDVTQNRIMTMGGIELMNTTEITKAGSFDVSHNAMAFYAEDTINWKAFTFRPGIRVEHDGYLDNTNVAPRFTAYWQASENTRFNIGRNRYYGRSFASMKLSEKLATLNGNPVDKFKNVDNLETPYSEEFTIGVNHNINNWAVAAQYIHRKNKKRLQADETEGYINAPDFHVNVYTLQVSNIQPLVLGATQWNASLGADWLDTGRSDLAKNQNPDELVYLDGKLMTRAQMAREVNHSDEEWMLRLGLDMMLPDYDITWANKVYVKGPVRYADSLDDSNGREAYKTRDFSTHTQFDSRIRWQPSLIKTHNMYVQLDVLNVFNQQRRTANNDSASNGMYTPGREYWLELGYEF